MHRILFGFLLLLLAGCLPNTAAVPNQQPQSTPPTIPTIAPTGGRKAILSVGEQAPALECKGWLHGPPPSSADGSLRYIVIDVWGRWCTEVPKAIPGLRKLHEEFGPQGVAFVSLTTESRDCVEQFVLSHEVPWCSGFEATRAMIEALGAANPGAMVPGYEVKPVLYLVDAQGRVVWSDNHQRMDHEDGSKDTVLRDLREELTDRLENGTVAGTQSGG